MSDIKILQVKLIKQGEGLELSFRNNEGVVSNDGKECKEAVHPDLVKAVNALCPHIAIHTDYLSEKDAMKRENLTPWICTGYSWNQKETGITLTGVRSTSRGKSVVLNIMLPMEGESAEEYTLQKTFLKAIKAIEFEVGEYLAGRKKAQGNLFNEEGDGKMKTVTNMKIAPPDETGMTGEGKEFAPNEYVDEFNKTAALRKAGKVTPIKKARGKKKPDQPSEDKEYTPKELEAHIASRKKKPGGKSPRVAKQTVKKNHLGQELSDSSLPVSDEDRKNVNGK